MSPTILYVIEIEFLYVIQKTHFFRRIVLKVIMGISVQCDLSRYFGHSINLHRFQDTVFHLSIKSVCHFCVAFVFILLHNSMVVQSQYFTISDLGDLVTEIHCWLLLNSKECHSAVLWYSMAQSGADWTLLKFVWITVLTDENFSVKRQRKRSVCWSDILKILYTMPSNWCWLAL